MKKLLGYLPALVALLILVGCPAGAPAPGSVAQPHRLGAFTPRTEIVSTGTYASRPTAGISGRVYYPNDGTIAFVDNGAAWQPLIGGRTLGTQVPLTSSLTAINAGGRSTTETDSAGTIVMSASNLTTADDFRLLKTTAPGGSYSFTVHLIISLLETNYSAAGILWRKSSNGSCAFYGPIMVNNQVDLLYRLETASSTGASPTFSISSDLKSLGLAGIAPGGGLWLRETYDGTNLVVLYSFDGANFTQWATVTTASAGFVPDEVGIWMGNANSAGSVTTGLAVFDSWLAQ